MGKLIVIDGLDGSGKETQSKLLVQELTSQGKNVRYITFPAYGTPGATLVEQYLGGKLGNKPSDTNPYAATTFFAVDRYYSFRTDWGDFYNQEDSVIIANRYTTSNAVHQLSKADRELWDEFAKWLFDYEYNKLGLPKPDMVIYLDVKPEVSRKLMEKRQQETGVQADIHEKDPEYLATCYKAAQYCADNLGWEKIICDNGENVLSIEEIQNMIAEKVTALLDIQEA
ncbi:MAG: thymidylate kinase [Clostridia bacterium]|nr:thymidylate kinase [Clostridia bacterium]